MGQSTSRTIIFIHSNSCIVFYIYYGYGRTIIFIDYRNSNSNYHTPIASDIYYDYARVTIDFSSHELFFLRTAPHHTALHCIALHWYGTVQHGAVQYSSTGQYGTLVPYRTVL